MNLFFPSKVTTCLRKSRPFLCILKRGTTVGTGMARHSGLKNTRITGESSWKYRRLFSKKATLQANFHSSQNKGENYHFTGNTGITGGHAMPVWIFPLFGDSVDLMESSWLKYFCVDWWTFMRLSEMLLREQVVLQGVYMIMTQLLYKPVTIHTHNTKQSKPKNYILQLFVLCTFSNSDKAREIYLSVGLIEAKIWKKQRYDFWPFFSPSQLFWPYRSIRHSRNQMTMA